MSFECVLSMFYYRIGVGICVLKNVVIAIEDLQMEFTSYKARVL